MDSVVVKAYKMMRILHYTLGFPPHRTGGLVKYAFDLMEAERVLGHSVFAIYPGNFRLFDKKSYLLKDSGNVYQLANGLPVPLMYGTAEPSVFITDRKIVGFEEFMAAVKPDVFHVHTLMGLPKELLGGMKQAGVRIVYTSHDYYGLCPKVNFINNKDEVCNGASRDNCMVCCKNAPGKYFLKVRNSKYVVPLKILLR